ncbi:hypothetical protein [Urechidicola vernalis]|uniref:Uncharacterized protein n=1 Tax=Urechidicola vernalis TaxID=3075600 RepID=A0ABU2Y462_9FLAO|nr:hypothetical protein [Urechidicola sp. P050]MDT0552983.1 hypothetical protein [Urechidicola sp. P050]
MTNRNATLIVLVAITLTIGVLLFLGTPILSKSLFEGITIPAGTLITWLGLIGLPLSIFIGVVEFRKPSNKWFRFLSILIKTILVLAILWVPISYLLSGSFSFNYSNTDSFQGGHIAMKIFWILSYGIAIGSLSILILYWISLLVKKIKK